MGYFGKCWDMVRIISEELGYTVAEYLNFRGWGFHRSLSKNNQPCLRYHRFEICMKQMPQEIVEVDKRGALSRHFAAMITSLFHVLKDAHQRVPSSIPRKFEDDFSTPARFGEKVNNYVQIYHLCFTTTIIVFKKLVLVKKIVIEKLVESIFGKLSSQREIYGTLSKVLQYLPDDATINCKEPELLRWLATPTLIARKIKSLHPEQEPAAYKKKLLEDINDILPGKTAKCIKGMSGKGKALTKLSQRKSEAVVRLRVQQLSDIFLEKYRIGKKGGRENRKKPGSTALGTDAPPSNDTTTTKSAISATAPPAGPNKIPAPCLPKAGISPLAELLKNTAETPIQFPQYSLPNGQSTGPAAVSASTSFYSRTSAPVCSEIDAVLTEGCIIERFPNVRVASTTIMNDISCILVSEPDHNATVVCQLSPVEVYFHSDLKTTVHRVSYIRDEPEILKFQPTRSVQWVPLSTSVEGYDFSVFRKSHPLFKKYFSTLDCDFLAMLEFLTRHGSTDANRDGEGASVGLRYDFGVGNQSYDTSDGNISGFHDPPQFDCGMKSILGDTKSGILLSGLGNIADAVQQLFDDHMARYIVPPARPQDDAFRNSLFSKQLCDMLGCMHARYEWVTILLKCLSAGHYVTNHFDKNNCSSPGYCHTANFSVVLMDSLDNVWRLSILFNQRQSAGDYMERENGVKLFLEEISLYLAEIDASYEKFMTSSSLDTRALLPICWKTYYQLFLCDASPWKVHPLKQGRVKSVSVNEFRYRQESDMLNKNATIEKDTIIDSVEILELRAGVTRDLWMSMAADVLRLARLALKKKPELVMELVLIALHQSGWLYFYLTIKSMLHKDCGFLASEDIQPGDVAGMYYKTSLQIFGGFHCGVKTRFSVGGIDFDEVYLKKPTNCLETAILTLRGFLSWADMANDVGPADLQGKFKEVLPALPGIAEFRLQMFLPLCGLSALLPNNLSIVDVAFPAKDRGSYKSLTEIGVKPERFGKYLSLISKHFGIDPRRTTWPEMMCCEKRNSRSEVTDLFIKWQSLSTIIVDDNGEHNLWVKAFNETEWSKVEQAGLV